MENNSNLLRLRGKSFFWASIFFSKNEQKDINSLYTFCRYIDDIGDNSNMDKKLAKEKLQVIIKNLNDKKSDDKVVIKFLELTKKYFIDKSIPIDLIKGVIKDLNVVNLKSFDELINYSYQVAGTVGLMMCRLMNVNDHELLKSAIQLGIAMQLTNISRDVKEDLSLKRIYLPKDRRNFCFSSIDDLINNNNKKKIMSEDIKKIIDYSNKMYKSAKYGINKLPFKHRFPIMLASNLYQQIGRKIIKDTNRIWKERVYINVLEKIFITFQTFLKTLKSKKNLLSINDAYINRLISDKIKK